MLLQLRPLLEDSLFLETLFSLGSPSRTGSVADVVRKTCLLSRGPDGVEEPYGFLVGVWIGISAARNGGSRNGAPGADCTALPIRLLELLLSRETFGKPRRKLHGGVED